MKTKLTVEDLQRVLDEHDAGVLKAGKHAFEDHKMCALESVSLARVEAMTRDAFTDNPAQTGMPDLRPLNDACWSSDKARTTAMLPLLAALSDYAEWSTARKQRWITRVSVRTVNVIIANLPHVSESVQQQCRDAGDLGAAEAAARAAEAAAWSTAARERFAALVDEAFNS